MHTIALMLLESHCSYDPKYLTIYKMENTTSAQSSNNQETLANGPGQNLIHHTPVITHHALPQKNVPLKSWASAASFPNLPTAVTLVCILQPGQSLACGIGPGLWGEHALYLSAKDTLRWSLSKIAMRNDPEVYSPGYRISGNKNLLSSRSPNLSNLWEFEIYKKAVRRRIVNEPQMFVICSALLPLCYGGIHLAAWNFQFPSRMEQIMWKVACFVIMGWPTLIIWNSFLIPVDSLLWILFSKILHFSSVALNNTPLKRIFPKKNPLRRLCADRWRFDPAIGLFGNSALGIYCFAYIYSRIFLIVESFISVRHLPIGVYITIDWSDYIPHL